MIQVLDDQLNLSRYVDEIVRLKDERRRLRRLLCFGVGFAEGVLAGSSPTPSLKEWLENAKKETE